MPGSKKSLIKKQTTILKWARRNQNFGDCYVGLNRYWKADWKGG